MNIIILGDKYQKRMKSKGCVGLIKINSRNILQIQHKVLRQVFPEANIVYVYGFEGKKFNSFINKSTLLNRDIISIYNPHYEKYNNAYSLSLTKDFLNDDCLILFGDLILSKKVFHKFTNNNDSQIFISKQNKNRLGCIINDNKIENISYDLDNYLTDIYYLTRSHTNMIKNLLENKINYNCFIFEIINKLIDMNQNIKPLFLQRIPSPTLILNKI